MTGVFTQTSLRNVDGDARLPTDLVAGTSAVARLRIAVGPCHQQVDRAFSAFDMGDAQEYGRFLIAHARATVGVEAALAECTDLPRWRPRKHLLLHDLEALDLDLPSVLELQLPEGSAARWGALYVLEGSRLGGAVLLRRTPSHYPTSFLSARHSSAEWRDLLIDIENRSKTRDGWIAQVEAGARACFDLYLQSAGCLIANRSGMALP
jgi:heme oxygenase